MAQSLAQFQHQRLRTQERLEVRLVTIHPASFHSPIQCSIDFAPLSHEDDGGHSGSTIVGDHRLFSSETSDIGPPVYEALSYTWGEANSQKEITLNGKSFHVTVNLYDALLHLRHHDRPRTLWVDAVCIDQEDDAEKRRQIPIMHLIYSQATRVLVWLGIESEDSGLAMQHIRDLHSTVEPGREGEISDTTHFTKWPVSPMSRAPLSKEQMDSSFALYRLLARPWFARAWVVQEIAFANDAVMVCGSSSVSWTQLRVGLHLTRLNHVLLMALTDIADRGQAMDGHARRTWPAETINNALSLLYDRERVRRQRPEPTQSVVTNLSWCMGINKARLCRFPQDRIYSVLGIAGRRFQVQIRPDYHQPVDQHYRDVVRYFLEATGSLDVVLHAQHNAWLVTGSSWAPNWGLPERAAIFHQNQQGLLHPMPIVDDDDVQFLPDSPILRIQGAFLGSIASTRLEFAHLLNAEQPYHDMSRAFDPKTDLPSRQRSWWEFRPEQDAARLFDPALSHLPADSPLWERHLELFLQTLAKTWYPRALSFFEQAWKTDEEESPSLLESESRFKGMDVFWDFFVYLVSSRTVCSTSDGRLVLAPDFTQTEDVLALLVGCSSPVILRQRSDQSYMLVGDAYALGLSTEKMRKDDFVEISLS